jgi:hypothetical protein
LVLLQAQIVAEEVAINEAAITATKARRGTDGEDERDDDDGQQYRENRAEMVLKVLLDPGNHGSKRRKLG